MWSSQGLWALLGKPSPEDAAPLFQGSPWAPFPSLGPQPLSTPVLCQLDGTRLQPLKPEGHVSTPPSTFCHQRFDQCPPEILGNASIHGRLC